MSAKRKQVILMMTDTQRTDMVGCYGNPDMSTPSLDRLAQAGVRFDRAYTCQPVCGPARSALFTGLYPHSNGSWGNSMPLGANVITVGQRLRDAGVHTGYVGKWHLDGGDYFGTGECPDGWDPKYWYDMRRYLEDLSPEDRLRSRSPQLNRDPGLTEGFTFGHQVSNRAIDFLARHDEEDFFLVVSYDEPHHPYVCPEPYASMYRDYRFPKRPNIWDDLRDKPPHQRVWAGERAAEEKDALTIRAADYLGCNSFVDYEIGRVLRAVDRFAPDALLIYTSDHGDFLGSHSLEGKGAAMYEEITRIPLIVRWPGTAPAGAACSVPLSHIDLAPSILQAFDLPVPTLFEGESVLSLFGAPTTHLERSIFMEFGRYEIDHDGFGGFQPIRAVFDGRYKLVINLLSQDELYDIQQDPYEMENLIQSPRHVERRNDLHDAILDWMNETRDPFRGYYWERRPWRQDAAEPSWDYTGMTRQRENEPYEAKQFDYDTGVEMERAVRPKNRS
jgi:uncharacterized sulfatase